MRAFWISTIAVGALAVAACEPAAQDQAAAPEATTTAAAPEAAAPAAPAPAPAPVRGPTTRTADGSPSSDKGQVTHERLLNVLNEPSQWLGYSREYEEKRFSPLDLVNDTNVAQLGLAWYADLPTNINIEGSPIFVDGVVYQPEPWSKVSAYDGATGELLWRYDPQVPGEWNVNVCCGLDLRGVTAWEGKIIWGTLDGRLVAVNAGTGELVWETTATPREEPYSITGAVRAADDKLFIGSAGGEFGVRGYIDAYNADTGEHLWRFWTVPGNPADGFEDAAQEMAAATWLTPGWWEIGGGGPVWDAITYDPVNDLVMFGTGNGSPWSAEHRDPAGGDNLFLASIVAVHADTGEYAWHYQQVPWETWDYDAGQQLTLADLEIPDENGVAQTRRVVMQASKNGVFYLLDAATGEFISATPYTAVNWASGWDPETGRPEIVPEARYDVENHAWNQAPGPAGGHAWQGMSYNLETGLVYIPQTETFGVFAQDENYQKNPGGFNLGVAFGGGGAPAVNANPEEQGTVGRLIAWDPVAAREVWRSADFPTQGGGIQMTGGIVSTGGNIVVQGNVGNREVAAYNATTGEKLWSFDAKTGVMASPITYEMNGEQYFAIAVGGPAQGGYYAPNGARLLVFKLGGTGSIPDVPQYQQPPFVELAQFATPEVVAHGEEMFRNNCSLCHGQGGAARATFPDLRRSAALNDQGVFDQIVLEGVLANNGMASFRDRLQPADTEAVRAYLIGQAEAARNAPAFGPPPALIEDEEPEEEEAEIHEDPNAEN